MQINREYEQEISLKDLLFHVLYHWRSCIIVALVGALIAGGFVYAKNLGRLSAGNQDSGSEGMTASGTGYMLNNYRNSAESYARILEGYSVYTQNSLLMQVDPNQKWVATASYCIQTDPMNSALVQSLLIAYAEKARENLKSAELKEIFNGVDTRYIQEIVETFPSIEAVYVIESAPITSSNSSNSMLIAQQRNTSVNECGCIFTIRVTGLNEQMADRGLQCFENYLQDWSAGEGQRIGIHQLIPVSRYVSVEVDANLENRQVSINRNIKIYKNAMDEAQNAGGEITDGVKGKSILKYALIGFLIGGFMAALIYIIQYMTGNRLHDADEISGAYGLKIYGMFMHSRARRPGKGIDGLLERLEFGGKRENNQAVMNGICSLIRDQYAGKHILLTGTISAETLCAFAEQLRKQLDKEVEIETQADFIINKEAIRACGSADAVLIVEQKDVSQNSKIVRMAEMLEISQPGVAGCVIL